MHHLDATDNAGVLAPAPVFFGVAGATGFRLELGKRTAAMPQEFVAGFECEPPSACGLPLAQAERQRRVPLAIRRCGFARITRKTPLTSAPATGSTSTVKRVTIRSGALLHHATARQGKATVVPSRRDNPLERMASVALS